MRRRLLLLLAIGSGACAIDRSGLGAADAGGRDAETRFDAGLDGAAFDAASRDGAADAVVGDDAGADDAGADDAGADAGTDAGLDAGLDAGTGTDCLLAVTPPTRDGLVLHLTARFGVSTEEAEDGRPRVVTWLDQSGATNHGAGRDVVYEPDGFGLARPSVRTQGLDESHIELRNPQVDDFTIFVVMRTMDRRSAGNWYDAPCILGGDASGDHPDAALGLTDGKLSFTRQEAGHAFRSSGRISDGMPHVISARRDGGSGDVVVRVDGADYVSGTSTTGRIEQPSNWWIAAHGDHARGRLDASFAEVRVYDRQLTDDERAVVENHLRCTWVE